MSKIEKSNVQEIFPLTSIQQGILYHYINKTDDNGYFIQMQIELCGSLDIEIFKKTWDIITQKNEALRTVFKWSNLEQAVQIVLKDYHIPVNIVDYTEFDKKQVDVLLDEFIQDDLRNNIDLETEPLRINLIKMNNISHIMIIGFHHIVCDGWSNGILLKEFMSVYESLAESKPISIEGAKGIVKDLLQLQRKSNAEKFWKEYLRDIEGNQCEKFCYNNIKKSISKMSISFSKKDSSILRIYAKEKMVTLAAIFYSIWGIALHKYNDSDEVIFGITLSGRNREIIGIENAVGLFINTLPIKVEVRAEDCFENIVKRVSETLIDINENINTSIVDLKKYCAIDGKKEIFNTIFVIENYPFETAKNFRSSLSVGKIDVVESTNYDITLVLHDGESLQLDLCYNNRFQKKYMERLLKHITNIVQTLVYDKGKKVSLYNILSREERADLVEKYNDTEMDLVGTNVIELFEKNVSTNANSVAIVDQKGDYTYEYINEKANILAQYLCNNVSNIEDSTIAIIMNKSVDMIISIIAILKTGAAYLPLDSNNPDERISYIIDNSKVKLVISDDVVSKKIRLDIEILIAHDIYSNHESVNIFENRACQNSVAYVIYTSGSTGTPKGVMIEHKALLNYVQWASSLYVRHEKLVFPLYTSVSVDLTITSIFVPLITNNTIVIYDCNNQVNALEQINKDNKVDIIKLTPSHLKLLSDMDLSETRIKKMILGGEMLEPDLVKKVLKIQPDMEIYNEYGPTEATVGTICHRVTLSDCVSKMIPIGRPAANTSVYIMDRYMNLIPEGCIGEIYLAGTSLARGYKDKINSKSFTMLEDLQKRVYKTGDKGRWNSNGVLEYYGRTDSQVKIRGHRIELDEIEWRVKQFKGVRNAVVSYMERGEDKVLIAYLVSDEIIDRNEITRYLKISLPLIMIPDYFVMIEEIPLASSGKILYKKLPVPTQKDMVAREKSGPNNEVESVLLDIWAQVIGINKESIGIDDNFFEIGGHSLKVTNMVARIHKLLRVKLNIGDVFKISTIRGLAEHISKLGENTFVNIEHVADREYYPLASAQNRVYILQQISDRSYNIPTVKRIIGKLEIDKLEKSLKILINRHEALRTSFIKIEGEPYQVINSQVDFEITHLNADEENIRQVISNFLTPFDLSIAPLFKVAIVTISENEHMLLFDMHHIITDGTSLGIITKELAQLYNNQEIPPLKLQYRDYAIWHNRMKNIVAQKLEKYWCDIFKEVPESLLLPYDFVRPDIKSFEGDRVMFSLNVKLYNDINGLMSKNKVTLFMVLLTAYNILLYKYSQQEDIVVGTPVAGRSHNDLNDIVGMFVNTLPLRTQPIGTKRISEYLNEVKNISLSAFENQEYQFEDLIEKVSVNRDLSRNPLFDVMFVLQNTNPYELLIPGCEVSDYLFLNNTAKFDVMLVAEERKDTVDFNLEYCTRLFKKETIERFVKVYINILRCMVQDINSKISDINPLSGVSSKHIISRYNKTEKVFPKEKLLYQFFEEKVLQYPDKVAIVCNNNNITYSMLNAKSNQVAHYLKRNGIGANSIVGIFTERTIEMLIGIMGILKAGAAYLPIDVKCPQNRLIYIINDCQTELILVQQKYIDLMKSYTEDFNERLKIVDLNSNEFEYEKIENLNLKNSPNYLCYVIYTSGSTGNPKGVMIEHVSIVNRMNWMQNEYKLSLDDVVLQKTPYTFDVSVWELFLWTFAGAKLCLLPVNGESDPNCIAETIQENNVTICHFVPSMLTAAIDYIEHNNTAWMFSSLKMVITSGEELKKHHAIKFYELLSRHGVQLANLYGPTEATVDVTYYNVPNQREYDTIPIGRPIDNTQIYILDKDENVADVNVPGELCIAGVCLARGYINQKTLTDEKFVNNLTKYETRIYKTGDKAKWLPDGNIVYLGRMDNQVKIRGNRIEIGEIEKKLLALSYVKDAVVIKKNTGAEDYLCAYVIVKEEYDKQKCSVTDIREHLLYELPEYMIPAYFLFMDKFPISKNGKLDIKALPEDTRQRPTLKEEYKLPESETQRVICDIWKEVLKVIRIGINDTFFEIGGNSLQLIKVTEQINTRFHVNIPVYEMFKHPTIKTISTYIDTNQADSIQSDNEENEKEYGISRRNRRNR